MAKAGEIQQFDWVWWSDEYLQVERVTKGGRKAKLIDPQLPPDEYEWVAVVELTKLTDAEYDEYVLENYDLEEELFCRDCGASVTLETSEVEGGDIYCRPCARAIQDQRELTNEYREVEEYD